MGKKKSVEVEWLLRHLAIQYCVFYIALLPFFWGHRAVFFAVFNTLIHGLIDWNIWKLYKLSAHIRIKKAAAGFNPKQFHDAEEAYQDGVKNWQYWEDHWFYATIGFDQGLHAVTLILLAGWLLV
jgi:hypothetical protein